MEIYTLDTDDEGYEKNLLQTEKNISHYLVFDKYTVHIACH